MTIYKEQAIEIQINIEIIDAFADGKPLQCNSKLNPEYSGWIDHDSSTPLHFETMRYRIKPKPVEFTVYLDANDHLVESNSKECVRTIKVRELEQ